MGHETENLVRISLEWQIVYYAGPQDVFLHAPVKMKKKSWLVVMEKELYKGKEELTSDTVLANKAKRKLINKIDMTNTNTTCEIFTSISERT